MTDNSLPEVQSSPLDEAIPESLDELFNKDPLELTEQDLVVTVAYFRRARETFLKQDAAKVPKGSKKDPAKKAAPKVALDAQLTLDDLELDL